jgi:hypothetical protein
MPDWQLEQMRRWCSDPRSEDEYGYDCARYLLAEVDRLRALAQAAPNPAEWAVIRTTLGEARKYVRSTIYGSMEMRHATMRMIDTILAAQPPAAPAEKRTPLDLAPAELNQLAIEAFGEAAARARSSAVSSVLIDDLRAFARDPKGYPDSAAAHLCSSAADVLSKLYSTLPQTSWQPIETAPKDGTLVLICGFGSEGYYVADAKWDGEWLLFHPDNDDHTEPSYNVSYWMPLPAPPSEVSRPHQRGGE